MSGDRNAHAEHLVETYLACHGATDLEGVMALFSDVATLEDPVGAPVLRGRDAIRAFYRATHARQGLLAFERIGPAIARGEEIAVHVRARLASAAPGTGTHVLYTIVVDGDGRIRSLRAYF